MGLWRGKQWKYKRKIKFWWNIFLEKVYNKEMKRLVISILISTKLSNSMETKRSCQLTASLCNLSKLVKWKCLIEIKSRLHCIDINADHYINNNTWDFFVHLTRFPKDYVFLTELLSQKLRKQSRKIQHSK